MGKVDSLQLVANFKTRLKVAFKHLKRLYISIRLMFRNKQSKSSQMSFYDESERQFAWKRWKIITVLLSFHSNVSLIMPFGLIRKFSTYLVKNFYLHRHSNSRPATEALYCTISPAGGGLWLYSLHLPGWWRPRTPPWWAAWPRRGRWTGACWRWWSAWCPDIHQLSIKIAPILLTLR